MARTAHFALHHARVDVESTRLLFHPVGQCWIGVLLPKRWAKRAVTRNTIRRQIYETARNSELMYRPDGAYVVRLRHGFSRQQFTSATSEALKQAIRQELLQLYAHCLRSLTLQRHHGVSAPAHVG